MGHIYLDYFSEESNITKEGFFLSTLYICTNHHSTPYNVELDMLENQDYVTYIGEKYLECFWAAHWSLIWTWAKPHLILSILPTVWFKQEKGKHEMANTP